MSRLFSTLRVVLAGALVAATGCAPQQPFYFLEDGDLSHYIETATEIDYPDVENPTLDDVAGAIPPLTLDNPEPTEIWELKLEEAVKIALDNSKVIRSLAPGLVEGQGAHIVDRLQANPDFASTVYDPALRETDPRFGVAAALAAFDAQLTTSAAWEKNDTIRNPFVFFGSATAFPALARQDTGSFQAQLQKTAATGGTWTLRHNVLYDFQPDVTRLFSSDWTTNVEAEFRQPLLQGNGVQFNRIAGPGSIPGFNNGVMIARVNTDISLTDFEAQVRNLVNDVERAYWELHFAYHQLDAQLEARDRALEAWREQKAAFDVGGVQDRLGRTRGKKEDVALARHQVFLFRGLVEDAQSFLYSVESNLRYIMGLAATDGRLIRPADEPTTAKVDFDYHEALCEALVRSVHLRRQKWQIKKREMELIAAKNYVLPRLDAVGRYRWLGLGDDLIDPDNGTSNAYGSMTDGNFQEWMLGFDLTIPLGFRKELAGVRNAQLNLARERAVLQDLELEVSHALQEAVRDLHKNYQICESALNRRLAAEEELETWKATEEAGMTVDEDRRLLAQQRAAQAKIEYYRALKSYNLAIAQVHFRKGSLLEYNGVYLAEGPWPAKAYFDATRLARARDASFYLDYGFTRPKVISRGAYEQHAGMGGLFGEDFDGEPTPAPGVSPEVIPVPPPEPLEQVPADKLPPQPEPQARSVPQKSGLESVEVRLGKKFPANAGVAIAPSGKGEKFDLGSKDLRVLAGSQTGVQTTPVARSSLVRPVAYQEAGSAAEAAKPRPAEKKWTSTKRLGARHESVANPSTLEADRNASGWKGVQR